MSAPDRDTVQGRGSGPTKLVPRVDERSGGIHVHDGSRSPWLPSVHVMRTLTKLLLTVLVSTCLSLGSFPAQGDTTEAVQSSRGRPFTLMQMNTCLSGLAGCYPRTQYPAVVDEAIGRIQANDADAVTLNEACSGDVARIAAETGYDFRFSTVIYRGAPLPCAKPTGRGVFGNAVLTKTHIASSVDAPYTAQNGVEERRWICVTTSQRVNACTSHLTTTGADAGTANNAQCVELTAVLERFADSGPTIFGGDVNRQASCAPAGFWTLTDSEATQARGIQHVYGTARSFTDPVAEIEPATYTDHDVLLVRSRLQPPPRR